MRAVAIAWLGLVALGALVAPWIAPFDPAAQDLPNALSGPTGTHPLGADALGQDVFSRLLFGARSALAGLAVAVAAFLALGVPAGLATGYVGGLGDRALMRAADLLLALPHVIALLVVATVFKNDLTAAMAAFGILSAPGLARVVRALTLQVRDQDYVAAARVNGLSTPAILARHILPRIAGTVVVQSALFAAVALLVQTGLCFLGVGPLPPAATWGGAIADGAQVTALQPWLLYPPGVTVALTILALGLLGNAVRDRAAPPWVRLARPAPAAADGPLLAAHDATVERGGVEIVRASFVIRPGETVALIGESGAGKTSLALAALGLLPATFMRGGRLGYVAQEPTRALDPTARVGALLKERGADPAAVLARVGLDADIARRYPHELSGGMAQRAGIALALAGEPDLIIADEPTAALDGTAREAVIEVLAATGTALLLITHDLALARRLTARALVVYAGEIVEDAPTAEMLERPRHPYTRALIAAHPTPATPRGQLAALSGAAPAPGTRPPHCRFADRCAYRHGDCTDAPIPLRTLANDRASRCLYAERVA